MIDLAALRSLEAVHEYGSVIAAAEALGFTPSAVSQQIKRLERQSGVTLLEKVGRGVILTGEGRILVAEGARIADDLERLETDLHARAGEVGGSYRLVGFSTAMRGLIGPVVADLLAEHRALRLHLEEVEPWDGVDRVAGGHADVAVVHRWGDVPISIPEHVDRVVVHRDEAEVIVHEQHRLARRRTITPRDLVGEHWIATPEGTICRQWLDRMYAGTGVLPEIEHVAMEFDSHLALVGARLGVALVPRLGRRPLGKELRAVPVQDPVPVRRVLALHRRSMGESPAIAALLAGMRAAATD